jgi:hypothetical protein
MIDESGNLDFGSSGTRHFCLTALCTTTPEFTAATMQRLKHQMLAEGHEDFEFHASTNKQATRDRVTAAIRSVPSGSFSVLTVWCRKRLVPVDGREPSEFLGLVGAEISRRIAASTQGMTSGQVVLMFDRVLTGGQRDRFVHQVKQELKRSHKPFRIHTKAVTADLNAQIADYFSWAWFRHLESGDDRAVTDLRGVPWETVELYFDEQKAQ